MDNSAPRPHRHWLSVLAVCVVTGGAGGYLVLDLLLRGGRHASGHPSLVRIAVEAVVTGCGCVLLYRRLRRIRRGDDVLSPTPPPGKSYQEWREDWRQARNAVRRGEPSGDPGRADLERALAQRASRPTSVLLPPAVAAACIAVALGGHTTTAGRWVFIALALPFVAATVLLVVMARWGRRYLAAAGR